jgi:GNAT superfamily N-acetyltransferase
LTSEDLPFVAELYASTRRWEVALLGWPRDVQDTFLAQQHEGQHRHYMAHYPGAEWLIVERAGRPIGRLYLYEGKREVRVVDVSLVADCRGAGVGGAILRDVLDDAQGRGKSVSIHVEKNNPARRLYERLGFVLAEDRGVYDLMLAECQQKIAS